MGVNTMADKKLKIFDYLCVILSAVALILECVPKNVMMPLCVDGHDKYVNYTHSYFYDPFFDGTTFLPLIVATLTILRLVLGIVIIIKDNKNIRIFNIIISLLTFYVNIRFITLVGIITEHEIIITILVFIQMFIGFALYDKSDQVLNKKITLLNIFNIIIVGSAMILQIVPTSIQIVQKFNFKSIESIIPTSFSYFSHSSNWMLVFGYLISLSTFYMLLFNLITLTKDKKALCIIQLVMSSICVLFSIFILIMAGSSATPYNVAIMLLFVLPIISQSIKLKTCYKEIKN